MLLFPLPFEFPKILGTRTLYVYRIIAKRLVSSLCSVSIWDLVGVGSRFGSRKSDTVLLCVLSGECSVLQL